MHFTNRTNDYRIRLPMKSIWTKITVEIDPRDYDKIEQKLALWPDVCGIMETEPSPSIIMLEIYSKQTNESKIQLLIDSINGLYIKANSESFIYDTATENEWKKYFKPQKIGKKFVIRPSWEKYDPKAEELVIIIDPGSAFGTGLHETTRGVLVLLEDIAENLGPSFLEAEILDAGTGSGVLSIGALLLGAKKIKAIDNDPEAVSVAKDNLKINNLYTEAEVTCIGLEQETNKYDVVLANIISEVLISNKDRIYGFLKDNGELILSGILQKEASRVIESYSSIKGLKLNKTLNMGEWTSIWFSKN